MAEVLTRLEYVDALLDGEKFWKTREHEIALLARVQQEWGSLSGKGPTDNALDMTEHEPGATEFNSFGPGGVFHVWNYPSLHEGLQAWHDILTSPEYAAIVALFHSENTTAVEIIARWNETNWGYCDPSLVGYVETHFDEVAALAIPTAGDIPLPEHGDKADPAPVVPDVAPVTPTSEAAEHAAEELAPKPAQLPVLHVGSTGRWVDILQHIVGKIGVDGIFGSVTEARVKQLQAAAKIAVDGVVGPQTWKALGVEL